MALIGPQLVTNDVYQFSEKYVAETKRMANVYFFKVMGTASAGDGMGNAGSQLDNVVWLGQVPIIPALRGLISPVASRVQWQVRRVFSVNNTGFPKINYTDSYEEDFAVGASPGTAAGDAEAALVTVSVQLRTGFVGKRYRGRKSYGPITETQTLSSSVAELTGAALSSWSAQAAWLIPPFTLPAGTVIQLGVFSAKLCQVLNPASPPSGFNAITTVKVGHNVGSLVKRKLRQP